MLQKMGWVKGKGLGAHEDGQLTHVSLHKRDDNLGTVMKVLQQRTMVLLRRSEWLAHLLVQDLILRSLLLICCPSTLIEGLVF